MSAEAREPCDFPLWYSAFSLSGQHSLRLCRFFVLTYLQILLPARCSIASIFWSCYVTMKCSRAFAVDMDKLDASQH